MSNYNNLKFAINNNIKTNGNEEITGAVLNSVLINMVSSLGAGYQFMGVATPSTNPGVPDQKVFYLAYTSGTYMNFSGIEVSGLCVLKFDTAWTKDDIPVSGGSYTLPIASANVLGGVKIGTGLSIDPQTGVLTATGGGSYVLPQASANALGGIKIGYVQSGKYYPVELDSNGKAYVYVPWQSGSGGSTVQWGTPSGDKVPLTVDGDTKQLLTAHQSLDDYVTKGTQQTITGEKTFTNNPVHIGSNSGIDVDGSSYIDLGDARLKWDSTNHSLYVTKRPGSSYAGDINLVVDGDVGAGGVGTGASVKYVNCASQSVYDNLSTIDPATMYTIGTAPSFTRIYLGSIKIYGN